MRFIGIWLFQVLWGEAQVSHAKLNRGESPEDSSRDLFVKWCRFFL